MPKEWIGGKIAVSVGELVPSFFSSINVLKSILTRAKNKPYGIKRLQIGGNGRELLVDFDSLDIEIQKALGDPRKVTNWMDKFFELDTEASRFYSGFRFEDGSGLRTEHVERYTVNASTLKACKLLRQARERERLTKGGSLKGVPKTIWEDAMGFRSIQRMKYQVEHTLPDNERRFLDALRKFENEGFASLISKKHKQQNALKVSADVLHLLNNLFAGTDRKPTMTQVAKQYMRFLLRDLDVVDNKTGEVINPDGYPDLADSTIMGYLAKWESAIGTHNKRAGNRQVYMNKYKVTHSLNRPNFVGSLISIDDRNPPFKMADGKRVWFYNAIDLCSEVWTCYVHGRTKEGIILDFYRQLIRNYVKNGWGMPLELECESSLNSSLVKSGLLQNGNLFEHVRMEANNATGKKIERYFRELRYGVEKEMDGWQARPFAKSEANQLNDDDVPVLSYDKIVKQTIQAMEDWNTSEHPIYKGKTRMEVHAERQNEKCKPICWEITLPYIGRRTKTSCNVGLVNLDDEQVCLGENGALLVGEKLISAMKRVEGKELIVYWLDDDEGNLLKAFAYIDGDLMAELVAKPRYNRALYERTEKDEENYAMMSAYSNTIAAYGTRQKNSVRPTTLLAVTKQDQEERVVEILDDNFEEEEERTYKPASRSLFDRF